MTQRVGLIGWPVEHSLSPVMHNAAFEALGLDWRYELLPTPPGQVEAAVAELRTQGFRGANVTVPHKQAVMPHLDSVADDARTIGAVNTVVPRGKWLIGDNTDADGFLLALAAAKVKLANRRVLVVGAGGGARAAVYGLLRSRAAEIVVLNRSPHRAEALAADLAFDRWPGIVKAQPLAAETLVELAHTADLLVNTTPVGMWPHVEDSIWLPDAPIPTHLAVYDLVYNPQETRLLRQARVSGAQPIGGLEMLVRQGALAFELWTGQAPPLEVMRAAAMAALEKGA